MSILQVVPTKSDLQPRGDRYRNRGFNDYCLFWLLKSSLEMIGEELYETSLKAIAIANGCN